MKRLVLSAFALATLVGCAKDSETVATDISSGVVATFAGAEIVTRTSGDEWEDGDDIGVYMFKENSLDTSYALAKQNVKYTTDDIGTLTYSDTTSPIYYPHTAVVDFYAYYPYVATEVSSGVFNIDMTAQNSGADGAVDQGAVDFMTSTCSGATKTTDVVSFDFDHKMSMVTLIIVPNDNIESLRGLVVKLVDTDVIAEVDVLKGAQGVAENSTKGEILFKTYETTVVDGYVTVLTATAIVIPGEVTDTAMMTFAFEGAEETYKAVFPAKTAFESGMNHTFNILAGYKGVTFATCTINEWGESTTVTGEVIDTEYLTVQ
ncbi:MAG: fimbrillin family protein [Rikenellaceae bacterium]